MHLRCHGLVGVPRCHGLAPWGGLRAAAYRPRRHTRSSCRRRKRQRKAAASSTPPSPLRFAGGGTLARDCRVRQYRRAVPRATPGAGGGPPALRLTRAGAARAYFQWPRPGPFWPTPAGRDAPRALKSAAHGIQVYLAGELSRNCDPSGLRLASVSPSRTLRGVLPSGGRAREARRPTPRPIRTGPA